MKPYPYACQSGIFFGPTGVADVQTHGCLVSVLCALSTFDISIAKSPATVWHALCHAPGGLVAHMHFL